MSEADKQELKLEVVATSASNTLEKQSTEATQAPHEDANEKRATRRPPPVVYPWWALAAARLIRYVIGYILPVYFIIAAIVVIALPSGTVIRLWPFAESSSLRVATAPSKAVSQAPQVAAVAAPPSTRVDSSAAPSSGDVKITDVAKMALDATKERVDMMKESYDKIFSFIAALGALLAFFGFKGLETFMATRARAEEATAQAEAAAADAEAAKREAREAIESFNDFRKNQYLIDNSAEINAAHGIVLREIADLYRKVKQMDDLMGMEADKARAEYFAYLENSLYYLDLATVKPEGVAPRILTRVYGTKGNVYRRLGNYHAALQAAEQVMKINPSDHSAYYNAACYKTLLAADEHAKASPNHAAISHYEKDMAKYLKRAIELNPEYRGSAKEECDFGHFSKSSHFLALTI